ncbi:MAG: hypothetical protein QW292_07010 [Candidatus Parvarchaeota archaeon]
MSSGKVETFSNRIQFIDAIARKIGEPLKKEEVEISLFGDSPIEETQRADIDMIEDDTQIRQTIGNSRGYIEAESIEEKKPEDFSDVIDEKNDSVDFRLDYFIDGSIRTKYIGELLLGNTGGPMVASNVGAIASFVDYKSRKVYPYRYKSNFCLYFPEDFPAGLKRSLEQIPNEIGDIQVEFLEVGESETSLRSSAGGKARARMHKVEIEVATKDLPEDRGWLAIDGALRRPEFYSLPKTIGVAKSFSTKVSFLGNDGKPPRTISHLARLKRGQRSPIYKYRVNSSEEGGLEVEKLIFWYLRLREAPPEMAPLGGIVKIDLGISSETKQEELPRFADQLSYSVLKVMNPSIFPRPRWPSFVYPVRVSEEYLDSLLFNQLEFNRLGMILRSVII